MNIKLLFKHATLALCLSTIFISCKKERNTNGLVVAKQTVDPSLVYRKPETLAEKQLVVNLEKITSIVKEVYKNNEALKVVNAAIQAKIYTDQSILLKDLIYPNEGLLATSQKFKELKSKLNIQESTFANAFWLGVNKLNDADFSKFLVSIKPNNEETRRLSKNGSEKAGSNDKISSVPNSTAVTAPEDIPYDDITICYPYSEVFISPITNNGNYGAITSVITATAEADEGYGWQPILGNAGNITGYNQVVINDDYAEANPTHIIGLNGVGVVNPNQSPNNVLIFPPGTPITVPGLPRQVKQVFVGEVRCTKQYDVLISVSGNGGGSEIRFTRSDGYLKLADGHLQADNFVINRRDKMERGDIRKKRWIDWTVQWDADWEADNAEQNLAIYEEDNRNSSSITLSLGTKVKITNSIEGTGTIGGTLNFKSDDAIIRQQNHKVNVFFALNRGYAGELIQGGWLVYDNNGTVSFTLQDRTLTP